jgi:hypothetical protein
MPESSRGALMLPLEGKRWVVSLGGRHGDKPPGDAEEFVEYMRQLRTPTLYKAIGQARRLGLAFGTRHSSWNKKTVVSAQIALDFPRPGSIAVHVVGPSWVAAPPGPERVCGSASIANGAMRIQR